MNIIPYHQQRPKFRFFGHASDLSRCFFSRVAPKHFAKNIRSWVFAEYRVVVHYIKYLTSTFKLQKCTHNFTHTTVQSYWELRYFFYASLKKRKPAKNTITIHYTGHDVVTAWSSYLLLCSYLLFLYLWFTTTMY